MPDLAATNGHPEVQGDVAEAVEIIHRGVPHGHVLSDDPASMKQGYVTLVSDADTLVLEFPSGAGTLDPKERDPELVRQDVRDGLVSPEMARDAYGVDFNS